MDRILNSQLNRLNTAQVDYYLMHGLNGPSWEKIKDMGAAEFLDRAKKDGRIVNAGFSFHGDQDAFIKIVDAYDWNFCQIQYNFLDQQNQAGTKGLKYAASKDLGGSLWTLCEVACLLESHPQRWKIWRNERSTNPSRVVASLIWNHPEVTEAFRYER
jgi:predicted aldo/keto reductase-like oxidoreductase